MTDTPIVTVGDLIAALVLAELTSAGEAAARGARRRRSGAVG